MPDRDRNEIGHRDRGGWCVGGIRIAGGIDLRNGEGSRVGAEI